MRSISPSSELLTIAGSRVVWHRWYPVERECRATLLFFHGQGDYGERYQELADFFLGEGVAFIICDLPGHGQSVGKRGHIPSWHIIQEIAKTGLANAHQRMPGKPVGLGGHSVGGLLALSLIGELKEDLAFSWISSPFLQLGSKRTRWQTRLLPLLSLLLPKVTVSTGVSAEMCRENFAKEQLQVPHFFHNRISFRWAHLLSSLAEGVKTRPKRIPNALPLLITQGEDDEICPAPLCQEFVKTLSVKELTLRLYPKTRHEPFADHCQQKFTDDLRAWLNDTLSS